MTRQSILSILLVWVWFAGAVPQAWARSRVVIDAAHGGSDGGSRANGQSEKDWTLKFAKALKTALEAANLDAALVRGKDENLPDDRRFEIINTAGAAVALVIHADRESTGNLRGPFLTVYPPQTSLASEEGLPVAGRIPTSRFKQSLRLARLLAAALGVSEKFSPLSDSRALAGDTPDAAGRILGVPHRSLHFTALPSVVVTPLFLSNKSDLKKYDSPEAIGAFARTVAQGVAQYLKTEGSRP